MGEPSIWCPIFIPDLGKITGIRKCLSRGFYEQNQFFYISVFLNNRYTLLKLDKDLIFSI